MNSPFLSILKNRIDLVRIPFTDRGSRLVVMADNYGLLVRLVERWLKENADLAAYRHRPPILQNVRFTDGDGRLLDFTLESYPHRLDFSTAIGSFSMTFADTETLLLSLPPSACGVTFIAHMDDGQADRRGGVLHKIGNIRRNMAYTTNRTILENTLQLTGAGNLEVRLRLDAGPISGLLLNITPRLGFNRYMPDIDSVFTASYQQWHDWFASAPPVPEPYDAQYYYAWWVMRAGILSTRFYTTREAMTPSKLYYIGIWQWDAYFHALAYRHINPRLAHDQIRVMLDHQRPDGMIPDAVHDEGTVTHLDYPVDADVTKPPLLGWTVWKLYETDHDREFLDEVYQPVVKLNQWWFANNDPDGDGLCEYLHPYSSGLDDNPLWDGGMPVTPPDLNTYLFLQMECLSRIAGVLGLPKESEDWAKQARALLERMNRKLWDPEAGLYWANRYGKPVRIRTPFSLMPLLTGQLPPEISHRLVQNLKDPATFWPLFPVPSVARNEPTYDPVKMWRGPTWINVNYLLQEGLDRSGYTREAAELRWKTIDLLMGQRDIYEFYDPEKGEPGNLAAPVFGWSASLCIELILRAIRDIPQAADHPLRVLPQNDDV